MSTHTLLFRKAPVPMEPTHSSFQNNYALHRAIGDIPDCVPAVDVLAPVDLDYMRQFTSQRADEFISLLDNYSTLSAFTNDPFHSSDVPLGGIKNPCKPYQNSYT